MKKQINKDTSLEELIDAAIYSAKNNVNSKEIFTVKDLFVGVEWKRLPDSSKKQLGIFFHDFVKNQGKDGYAAVEKTRQNQRQYKKK
ncbi:MAG: DUF1413 domain-containing protein [Clostridiales bacterium]|jgi:hypothetical protein|nr:DUF1413 domain-containing protein [Clostridiales bacterium]